MPSFDKYFRESKGQPIMYGNKKLYLMDRFPISGECHLRLTFESINSKWEQGVKVETDKWIKYGQEKSKKGFRFWKALAPPVIDFVALSKNGELLVWNIWDNGGGRVDSGFNGAAMIIEEIPNGRRYRCNDGEPDEDFDDLVFRIEKI